MRARPHPRSQLSPALATEIADLLHYAYMRCNDSADQDISQFEIRKAWRESAEAVQVAHAMLTQVAKLSWEVVLEPHIVTSPDLTQTARERAASIKARLDDQPIPLDRQAFANEKTICSVMQLMAPLLLRFGILVEF